MSEQPPYPSQGSQAGGYQAQSGQYYGPPPNQYSPQPGQYGTPPPGQYGGGFPPAAKPPGNGLAIGALVSGIVAILFCWTVVGGVLVGILAAVLGFVARNKVKKGEATGSGMAITGAVLGLISVVLGLISIVLLVALFNWVGADDYVDCLNKAGNDTAAQEQCQRDFDRNINDRFGVTVEPSP